MAGGFHRACCCGSTGPVIPGEGCRSSGQPVQGPLCGTFAIPTPQAYDLRFVGVQACSEGDGCIALRFNPDFFIPGAAPCFENCLPSCNPQCMLDHLPIFRVEQVSQCAWAGNTGWQFQLRRNAPPSGGCDTPGLPDDGWSDLGALVFANFVIPTLPGFPWVIIVQWKHLPTNVTLEEFPFREIESGILFSSLFFGQPPTTMCNDRTIFEDVVQDPLTPLCLGNDPGGPGLRDFRVGFGGVCFVDPVRE